jgi:hypothetical protein
MMDVSLVARFAEAFVQRWDQYAVQQRDGSYRLVVAPLSLDLVAGHLAGRWTLGSYLLDAQSRCRFAVFDDDTPQGLLRLADLAQRLRAMGIGSVLEASRMGRAHLWVHMVEPVPAVQVRAWLLPFAEELGIEFYPKQDRLVPGGSGSLIRLPLGVHRRARTWFPFVVPGAAGELLPVGATVEACVAWVCEAVQPVAVPAEAVLPVSVPEVRYASPAHPLPEQSGWRGEQGSIRAWCQEQDIVAVIGQYVELDARGVGSCPFPEHHRQGDVHPSFHVFGGVDPHWYCYTWQRAGDVFDFLCLYYGLSKREMWARLRQGGAW